MFSVILNPKLGWISGSWIWILKLVYLSFHSKFSPVGALIKTSFPVLSRWAVLLFKLVQEFIENIAFWRSQFYHKGLDSKFLILQLMVTSHSEDIWTLFPDYWSIPTSLCYGTDFEPLCLFHLMIFLT